jgi:serine/threonine protein phosphatase 1
MLSGIMDRMWRNLFGPRRGEPEAPRRKASVPDGTLLYAIGDIHGQANLLEGLLSRIHADAEPSSHERRILLFIGDYVDRGLGSRAVVERVVAGFPRFETVALKGNHEQMLLDFLSDPKVWDTYRRLGGIETLLSYGVDRKLVFAREVAPATVRDAFVNVLPRSHQDFLRSLALGYDCGDYHFVHAGVRPGVPLELQSEMDRLWIRDPFLSAGDVFGGRVIVHGHTPAVKPESLGFRIGIDTGAYMTGRLTAARFEGSDIQFLHN